MIPRLDSAQRRGEMARPSSPRQNTAQTGMILHTCSSCSAHRPQGKHLKLTGPGMMMMRMMMMKHRRTEGKDDDTHPGALDRPQHRYTPRGQRFISLQTQRHNVFEVPETRHGSGLLFVN